MGTSKHIIPNRHRGAHPQNAESSSACLQLGHPARHIPDLPSPGSCLGHKHPGRIWESGPVIPSSRNFWTSHRPCDPGNAIFSNLQTG